MTPTTARGSRMSPTFRSQDGRGAGQHAVTAGSVGSVLGVSYPTRGHTDLAADGASYSVVGSPLLLLSVANCHNCPSRA